MEYLRDIKEDIREDIVGAFNSVLGTAADLFTALGWDRYGKQRDRYDALEVLRGKCELTKTVCETFVDAFEEFLGVVKIKPLSRLSLNRRVLPSIV